MPKLTTNPAKEAARVALAQLFDALDKEQSFIFEAGAGAGKTYSLVCALDKLLKEKSKVLLQRQQSIACITYTNVAKNEILDRTDRHQAVTADTIHGFCWSLIKGFQQELRRVLPSIGKWQGRLAEFAKELSEEGTTEGGQDKPDLLPPEAIKKQPVIYQLGYPSIDADEIRLGHDDVVDITVVLLKNEKFKSIVQARHPIIFIDEYQDTHKELAEALLKCFVVGREKLVLGFFGDHWQKIYGSGCGKIDNVMLRVIPKNANFRSVSTIVDVLNKMRPALRQDVEDPSQPGYVGVYHSNSWTGQRRTGNHWAGDLPAEDAHQYLTTLRSMLEKKGWDFSPSQTKILMLTHNVLAMEQGYHNLAAIFTSNEAYIKKEDKYMEFFMNILEPVCEAFSAEKFGEMFTVLGIGSINRISTHADKVRLHNTMKGLIATREKGTIGELLDYLEGCEISLLSKSVGELQKKYQAYVPKEGEEEPSFIKRVKAMREVAYQEVIAVTNFVKEYSPFATKHSVKGEEFENVLVVVGRGWNQYNFDQMLKWFEVGVPSDKNEAFERSRNLFYVACSRPKRRLGVLFTQLLSAEGLSCLENWFGRSNVHSLEPHSAELN